MARRWSSTASTTTTLRSRADSASSPASCGASASWATTRRRRTCLRSAPPSSRPSRSRASSRCKQGSPLDVVRLPRQMLPSVMTLGVPILESRRDPRSWPFRVVSPRVLFTTLNTPGPPGESRALRRGSLRRKVHSRLRDGRPSARARGAARTRSRHCRSHLVLLSSRSRPLGQSDCSGPVCGGGGAGAAPPECAAAASVSSPPLRRDRSDGLGGPAGAAAFEAATPP
mmetsp:Transcript_26191/g.76822  ORF Transcript_26191/g.76822 Transcript_26191/m.76822 type:complete len:228 (+) Transcript_26191:1140-1823(+)